MLTEKHLKILTGRGLDAEVLARFGVASVEKPGGEDWISIPFIVHGEVVNRKHRTISGQKKFYQEAGAQKVFFNQDVIFDPTLKDEPLVITEGEFDALAAIQAGFIRTVSVPDGAPSTEVTKEDSKKYSFVTNVLPQLQACRQIIIAVDGDGPGQNLMNDLVARIGRVRCKLVRYPNGCKDLNDALKNYKVRGVQETLRRAEWIDIPGVYLMSDLPDVEIPTPHPLQMPVMDNHYRPRLGDFCVVTGIPSHGKSSWLNETACRLALIYGWRTCFASFEQRPKTDHRRNLRTYFNRKRVIHQSQEEIARADEWIDRHFCFMTPEPEDVDITLDWVMERCAAAVIRFGAKVVMIDPWNEMDHQRPPDMTLTEYTGFAIKQFKAFARKHKVHMVVAAHPAKMYREKGTTTYPVPTLYDISDSAHWANKPDVGIVVWRGERDNRETTVIKVVKSRYRDEIGIPGEVEMDFSVDDQHYTPIDTDNSRAA